MKLHEQKIYDVAVIGAGPAGLMAAGRAAELGAKVVLVEKNNRPGIKLLMTGHGRANLTNNCSSKEFIVKLGNNGKFLYSSLHKFGPSELMDFFRARKVELKIEHKQRVFPQSNRATTILEALLAYLETGGVEIKYNSEVIGIKTADQLVSIKLINGKTLLAKSVIITTGGQSYSATGSTGDGYAWASTFGHEIVAPVPGLTGLLVRETWIKELEGLSLKNIEVSLWLNKKKIAAQTGDLLFTAHGLTGPVIHDLSRLVVAPHKYDLHLDFLGAEPEQELDRHLQMFFHDQGTKQIKNGLLNFLPPKLLPIVLLRSRIDPAKQQSEIRRAERLELVKNIKRFKFLVLETEGFAKANVTVGGVALENIDPRTMQSKLASQIFFAGEVLDLDGPTGGYNLQIAWTTGRLAGEAAARQSLDSEV